MIEDIKGMIFERLNDLFLFSLLVLLVGAVGGLFLTKSIRKDILGLEPREIASLYRDRKAVLRSVKEGIIAVDQKGMITLLNHSARKMLGSMSVPSINILKSITEYKNVRCFTKWQARH